MAAPPSLPFLFLDINTLNDFLAPGAPMAGADIDRIKGRIGELADYSRREKLVDIAAADAHAANDPEFAAHGLPPHALAGSEGQKKIRETFVRSAALIPAHGKRRPWPNLRDLRAFGGQLLLEKTQFDLFSNPALRELLRDLNPKQLYLYGATLEHDLRATALSARIMGYEATIVEDAAVVRDPAEAAKVRGELLGRGVRFAPTDEVLIQIAQMKKRLERSGRQASAGGDDKKALEGRKT